MPFAQKHVVLDSPVNNFATLNPLDTQLTGTFSNGNLIGSDLSTVRFTMNPLPVGKWYAEFYVSKYSGSGGNHIGFGRIDVKLSTAGWNTGDYTFYKSYLGNGQLQHGGGATSSSAGNGYNIGDIISVILDFDNETINFLKNNQTVPGNFATDVDFSNVSNYHIDGKLRNDLGFIVRPDGGHGLICNFGQNPTFCGEKSGGRYSDANGLGQFYYKPPWGALALCSANIEKNEIYAAKERADQHFKAVTYTGNVPSGDTTSSQNADFGILADLIWIKDRNSGTEQNHGLFDSVRGLDKWIGSNTNSAQDNTANAYLSYVSDTTYKIGWSPSINSNTHDKIAWCWKAGGAPDDANTAMIDGVGTTVEAIAEKAGASITPTAMSVNTKAGFSIVKYTGKSQDGATVPHGLNKVPEMVIVKNITSAANGSAGAHWIVRHQAIGMTGSGTACQLIMSLNLAAVANDHGTIITNGNDLLEVKASGSTPPYFHVGESDQDYIAYCWHSVPGYSKFGSYTGNGNADGPFVYTGFKPAYVMWKRTDVSNNWIILDTARDINNAAEKSLIANEPHEESLYERLDLLSNGFKLRQGGTGWLDQNADGGTYIFMAFAEAPPTVPEPIKYSPKKERHALKFDGSSYLSRTPTAGNRKTWTWSGWAKRSYSPNSAYDILWIAGSYNGLSTAAGIKRGSNDILQVWQHNGSSFELRYETTAVFRDFSSWHHFVFAADISNSSVKIYVDGQQITSFGAETTNPASTVNTVFNTPGYENRIGGADRPDGNDDFNGYLADIHFIDGQALGPEHFGKTENGIWEPKHYQGSYGRNGFFLDFHPENLEYDADGITLDYVKDSSGNGNHWNGN